MLFWTSTLSIWHLYRRPAVATLEPHGLLDFPGGYGAVVLFEVSTARPPSESGSSDGSLPPAHSVFGSGEEEDVEVEAEVEEDDDQEFEEVEVEEEDAEEEEIVVEDWLFDSH